MVTKTDCYIVGYRCKLLKANTRGRDDNKFTSGNRKKWDTWSQKNTNHSVSNQEDAKWYFRVDEGMARSYTTPNGVEGSLTPRFKSLLILNWLLTAWPFWKNPQSSRVTVSRTCCVSSHDWSPTVGHTAGHFVYWVVRQSLHYKTLETQQHHLIEQVFSYRTQFPHVVITLLYVFLPTRKKAWIQYS